MADVFERQKECLARRVSEELERLGDGFELPIHLGIQGAICLVGNLQLALRHPGNTGPSSLVARELIDGIVGRLRESGYVAVAELAALGDDPQFDDVRTAPAEGA